ncbi:MAG TPA: hypothetical protein VN697_08125 [Tepidiformaceae bacterium]|nr:hypothetical protein [Tepidiformaceae bacterium]
MRKKLSIVVALAAVAVIAAATVSSAFASPPSVPLDCGAAQNATGISALIYGSSGWVETDNSLSNSCYNLYASGEVLLASGSWIDLGSVWVGGYPGSVLPSQPYSGDVVQTEGVNNACNNGFTVCAGYKATSNP